MYVHVRVATAQKKEVIEEVDATHLKIAVREPAERNLANRRVIELIARYFATTTSKVRLVNGHTAPSKLLSVDI